jgi:hypothetical protein
MSGQELDGALLGQFTDDLVKVEAMMRICTTPSQIE